MNTFGAKLRFINHDVSLRTKFMLDKANMLSKFNRQLILGELKREGSTDPDILYSAKLKLLMLPNTAIKMGYILIFISIIAAITIVMIPFALLMIPFSIFLIVRGMGNKRLINTVFEEYTQQAVNG